MENMKRFSQSSAKEGATASARRVLAGVSTPTTAPTHATDGYLLGQSEWVHVLSNVTGTSPVFTVQVWLYSEVSQLWHLSTLLTINAADILTLEHVGFHRIYLQVTGVSGTSPTLSAWVALVRETT
jgi:hypothetical protein